MARTNPAGYQKLIWNTEGRISSRKATLWKGFVTSATKKKKSENRKHSKFEDLAQSYTCWNCKLFILIQ